MNGGRKWNDFGAFKHSGERGTERERKAFQKLEKERERKAFQNQAGERERKALQKFWEREHYW